MFDWASANIGYCGPFTNSSDVRTWPIHPMCDTLELIYYLQFLLHNFLGNSFILFLTTVQLK